MLSVTPIPAFSDNYIWLLRQDSSQEVCVVDPGDAEPVIQLLERENLTLGCILVTHHHHDHTGGIAELVERYSPSVVGPRASDSDAPTVEGITEIVGDGDELRVMGRLFEVMAVPGHTLDHIAFFTAGIPSLLFCGDTLFSGGCGRLFEGSPEQMLRSLERLNTLPAETLVFSAHEYTLANLAFAQAANPGNPEVARALTDCQKARELDRPTLPTTMERERRINPFLRCDDEDVKRAASAHGSTDSTDATFATLRAWKDDF
ncbi:hydroxyacylglutathione hydrolase [Halomonas sp. DP8Y7-1]|uniref:hydroxyacylglutathione hydrolase n=1 Tax=Halomonas sp. DP8Y7-1 TaxID=2859078 RepID=UPI001C94EE5A|nr:hydroxyacylglutathione hydrolase [Halomonas sp. DP8Y7-1]MBY6029663.1 hydroxyacylglutathione hydrolase [Halomonas sp. DP8Y7-1]